MFTPARSLEEGSSRCVTWWVQPPSCTRRGARSKEYQSGPGLPRSVKGGALLLGFCPSSGLFSGPGSLSLRSASGPLVGGFFISNLHFSRDDASTIEDPGSDSRLLTV